MKILPWDPIGRLFGINTLIVFVISEIFKTIKDHNDSPGSISGASSSSLSLWIVASTAVSHRIANGITHEVKASGEVDTKLVINDMHKSSLHIRELFPQLN